MSLRRMFFGTACASAAIFVLASAACSSFSSDETPPADEGGAAETSAPEAAPAADATAAGDTGKQRWCATQDAGFLCDDFDDPNVVGWAPWNRLDLDNDAGGGRRDLTLFQSAPASFLVTANGIGRQMLQKPAVLTEKRLVWTFDMKLEQIDSSDVVVAEVAFGAPGNLIFKFGVDKGTGKLGGAMDFSTASPVPFVLPPLAPELGEWLHIKIEFFPKTGSDDEYHFTIGDAPPAIWSKPLPTTNVALGLGAQLYAVGSARVRFDNVAMTLAP